MKKSEFKKRLLSAFGQAYIIDIVDAVESSLYEGKGEEYIATICSKTFNAGYFARCFENGKIETNYLGAKREVTIEGKRIKQRIWEEMTNG